jgi:hypothetical protein
MATTSSEFILTPGTWVEVAAASVATLVQNLSSVEIVVRTGSTLPASTVKSGVIVKPKDFFTIQSNDSTEKCYARILNDNSSNATIFVWS